MLKRFIALCGAFLLLLAVGATDIGPSSVGIANASASVAADEYTTQNAHGGTQNAHGEAVHTHDGGQAVATDGEAAHDGGEAVASHGEGHGGGHHEVAAKSLTPDVSWQGWLPLISIFFPLVMAMLIPLFNQ